MENTAIKIENVSKEYRLGAIGGGTLQGDLQSFWAKIRHKEDPNTIIGEAEKGQKGDRFMALNGVSFEVKKGEALGIIGHNGAGKSTLLKLLCRVTAPSDGKISYNGRIASMLEVGTGFHPELTGRENVYMNGAILGMTKAEIDKKFDEIVAFAEMEKFIDTPVKRYSSGMYVKLAFSVAAHLDSEIMIMDEVLAVGDVNFQQKCLQKMRKVAKEEGRTILYVSHNMATIKTLCDRCIVLKKGQVIFDGDVDEAINVYSNDFNLSAKKEYDFTQGKRIDGITNEYRLLKGYLEKSDINLKENLKFTLDINACESDKDFLLRYVVFNSTGNTIGTAYSNLFNLKEGNNSIKFTFSTKNLTPGKYMIDLILCQYKNESQIRHDIVVRAMAFNIEESEVYYNMKWLSNGWGNIKFEDLETSEDKNG